MLSYGYTLNKDWSLLCFCVFKSKSAYAAPESFMLNVWYDNIIWQVYVRLYFRAAMMAADVIRK